MSNILTQDLLYLCLSSHGFGHAARQAAIISKIPSARLGEPNDIANAVLFLCSDQSSYINGETLHVNGGMYMA